MRIGKQLIIPAFMPEVIIDDVSVPVPAKYRNIGKDCLSWRKT